MNIYVLFLCIFVFNPSTCINANIKQVFFVSGYLNNLTKNLAKTSEQEVYTILKTLKNAIKENSFDQELVLKSLSKRVQQEIDRHQNRIESSLYYITLKKDCTIFARCTASIALAWLCTYLVNEHFELRWKMFAQYGHFPQESFSGVYIKAPSDCADKVMLDLTHFRDLNEIRPFAFILGCISKIISFVLIPQSIKCLYDRFRSKENHQEYLDRYLLIRSILESPEFKKY